MRAAVFSLLFVTAALSGCSRVHLYKTAGRATHGAFKQQAQANNAPRPRGIDGEEASLMIAREKKRFGGEDDSNGQPGYGGGPKPPVGLMLQAK